MRRDRLGLSVLARSKSPRLVKVVKETVECGIVQHDSLSLPGVFISQSKERTRTSSRMDEGKRMNGVDVKAQKSRATSDKEEEGGETRQRKRN